MQKYVSDRDLAARYNIARPSLWRWVRQNDFPPPVRLSAGCTRWRIEQVESWEATRAEKAA